MPLVVIRYQASLPEPFIRALATKLPEIVASALHVEDDPEAHLSAHHVMVDAQLLCSFAVNANACDISIDANEYPGRLFTIDDRRHVIAEGIRTVLADYDLDITCGVWVRLVRGSYEEV